jgi:4-hydroxy-tetrahydrodipicolinate synthase
MQQTPKFQGVVPPVVTPLTDQREVDYQSLGRVIEHLIDAGVNGLFLLGSTSEVVFHDGHTRRRIVDFALEVCNGRVPVFVGAIDPTTDRVIAHAKSAEKAGADAVVATAPFYARTSQPEIGDHFRYLREAIDIPVIAYDIPVCVHVKLDRQTTVALAREGAIAGLKDSSGDDGNFRSCLLDLQDHPSFSMMTGSEVVADTALMMGAHGIVPGLANVDPHGYVRLWRACQMDDLKTARQEQERLCRLFEMVFVGLPRTSAGSAGVGSFKTAMRELGIITTNQMARPQRALNGEETAKVRKILDEAGLLGNG